MLSLIVGLGNPGEKYKKNRHNIGFDVVDALADRYGVSCTQSKFQGVYCKMPEIESIAIKPLTYMNNSGVSVLGVMNFFKILKGNVFVVHDDLDLGVGEVRVKLGGGNAGHNGLKSIDKYIGAEYWRIRIGIGRPEAKEEVANYVLDDFSKEEALIMGSVVVGIVGKFEILLRHGKDRFLSELKR